MDRRALLQLAALAPLAAALPASARDAPAGLLSAWAEGGRAERRYYAGYAAAGARALELPARGHAVLAHPALGAYACARRPGEYLLRFDPASGALLARAAADAHFRFAGHAIVDTARSRLLATQIGLEHGEGRIGLYDAERLAPLGEWPTHGLGPHELLALGDARVAVANGGILTLPETGRLKRNLDTMAPSLVLLDAADGRKLAQFELAEPRLSIRHLALAADGVLGAALQFEGEGAAPVAALLRDGQLRALDPVEIPYGAAIAACGERFAVTCTRSDRVIAWDTRGRRCGEAAIAKPSGIVAAGDGWLVSNEFGEIWRLEAGRLDVELVVRAPGRAWDNHLATSGSVTKPMRVSPALAASAITSATRR